MSWTQKAAVVFAALMLAATPLALAQPSLQDFLTQQLDSQEPRNADQGYAHAAGPLAGSLASQRVTQLPLTLRVGQQVRIVGVCDQNCADLDIRVLDPQGGVVAEDVRDNARPAVDLRARHYGAHTIEVGMADCEAPRCRFAVNVYTR